MLLTYNGSLNPQTSMMVSANGLRE